jgi:hypothetical protein
VDLKFLEPKEEETKPLFEPQLYRLARAYDNASRDPTRVLQAWADETEDNLRAYLGQHAQLAEAMTEDVFKITGIRIERLCPTKRKHAK